MALAATACNAFATSTSSRLSARCCWLAAPLKIRNGTGSPLRVLALTPRRGP